MANQIYCKHCGKLIDADSSFCMHCGGAINSNNKTTPQANKQDVSFIRQLDILGGKFLIGIINFIKWCGRTLINFGKFLKPYWKRILIFILGIAGAILLIYLGYEEVEEYRAMFIIPAIILIILTLYFSCSKSIKLILPSSILLLCSYGASIYYDPEHIYGSNTTFFDTVKREFYWITPNYTIPDHATSIGERAFSWCSILKSITIPNSVNSIGTSAFCGCNGELIINSKTLVENDYTSYDYPMKSYFYGEGWLSGSHFTKLTIGDNITKIGEYAFYNCSSLTSVTIGNGVTESGEEAFSGCTSLTSINITDLSAWCKIDFSNADANPLHNGAGLYIDGINATNITIPSDITKIKFATFYGCTSLTSVTIPNSVTSIGKSAFCDCSSLASVYCEAKTPPRGRDYMFYNNASGRKIYVPRESVKAYKSAKGWSEYAKDIVGYDF